LVRSPFTGEQQYPERNRIYNLMPSCASCNNYKSSHDLETFRGLISNLRNQLILKYQYNISIRYGLIIEIPKEIVFYFETLK
jgi:hypothetical protein